MTGGLWYIHLTPGRGAHQISGARVPIKSSGPGSLPRDALRVGVDVAPEVLSADGNAVEMRDSEDDSFRAADELGIDLSHSEPSSVEEV